MPRILAFAGSTRTGSVNKMLLRVAAEEVKKAGGEITLVDLRDLPMPLYDGDLEESEGPPPNATKLYELMKDHQGLLLACPEYNSSITGVLKNAIDWVSRPREGEPPLAAFSGKVAALMSASPGALGGLRGLVHVRSILGNMRVTVIPNQVAATKVMNSFDSEGNLTDERLAENIAGLAKDLVETTRKLHA